MEKLLTHLVVVFLFFVSFNFAFAEGYQPLSPIPVASDFVGPPAPGSQDLSGYLKSLYNFGIGIAAGLAVMMVIWGGVEYMTTDAIGHHEEGKMKIQNAIMGLLLALSSYIILQTINKDLLKLDFDPNLQGVDATYSSGGSNGGSF